MLWLPAARVGSVCVGISICGTVDKISIEDTRKMFDANFWTTFYPTRFVLQQLKKSGDGLIVLTGSQVSLHGIYSCGPLAAAKFAFCGFAETIIKCSRNPGSFLIQKTPGFEFENLSRPEVAEDIARSGGLPKPEVMAQRILKDSLVRTSLLPQMESFRFVFLQYQAGDFISTYGIENWLRALICSGLSPWGGLCFSRASSPVSIA